MITMVDSIESPATTGRPIPAAILSAQAVGAYVWGNSWPTYRSYALARPDLDRRGWIVTITLSVNGLQPETARCGDFENGGLVNAEVGRFLQLADYRLGLPWLYTFAGNGADLLHAAEAAGYNQGEQFYYWSAHYGVGAHICAPDVCGYPRADGTQYTYQIPGNCDGSLIQDYMLPQPQPITIPEDSEMITSTVDHKGNIHVFVEVPHSKDDPTQGATVFEVYQDDGVHWVGGQPNVRKAQAFPLVSLPKDVA